MAQSPAERPEAPKKSIDEKTSRTPEAVAPILPPGARAVPIRVRTDSIGDGFASLPASRVAVRFRVNQGNRGETAEMVLENVLVVAADMPHKNDKTTLVTLALMSGDASRLAEVQGRGGLFLALRRQEENEKK